ncbi:KxYKxGKxW signal peptide domain-containing protein [Paucilactobacillus nenjiangensis]|uniref:KxYKxGKxW signal peptide domain-containing protein n=1 Tax=Paucilactobacillus nenjiangensis TaxID=1296540 RepID=UPI003BB547EC
MKREMVNEMNGQTHYKMYKANKHWIYVGITLMVMTGAVAITSGNVRADVNDPTAAAPLDAPDDSITTAAVSAYQSDRDAYQSMASTASASATQAADEYNSSSATSDYAADLASYNTASNAATYDTKAEVLSQYNDTASEYAVQVSAANSANTVIEQQNNSAQASYESVQTKYDALPAKIKTAGALITEYNKTTDTVSADIAAKITKESNTNAVTASTSSLSNLLKSVNKAKGANSATPITVASSTDGSGAVTATLFGATYTDQNGDGKITFEDDIIPELQTPTSLADVTVMFYYLKRVADTALDSTDANGTAVKAVSAGAAATSMDLMNTASGAFKTSGSTAEAALVKSIQTELKTDLENKLKDIYSQAGMTFDEAAFDATYVEQLKQIAIDNYKEQTAAFLQTLNDLLVKFQAATTDTVWTSNSTNPLVGGLKTVIAKATQQVTDGLAEIEALPASDDFLKTVYSGNNKITNSINSIWSTINSSIDNYGRSTSPMMKTVLPGLDTNGVKSAAGTFTFSNEFVASHQVIFDAAIGLADAITKLAEEFFGVTDDLQQTIQPLVTISGSFDVSAPTAYTNVAAVALPTAPAKPVIQGVDKEPTTPQARTITIIPVDLSGNPLEYAPSFTIDTIPGVTIDTPTVAGYSPQNAKLTPTPGENKVVYIPVNYAGNEGDGIQVKTAVSEGGYHEAKTADPIIVPEENKVVETVTDLGNNQPKPNQSIGETTNNSGKSLPQTGESSQSELATIGLMLLGFMGLAAVGKKKRY